MDKFVSIIGPNDNKIIKNIRMEHSWYLGQIRNRGYRSSMSI